MSRIAEDFLKSYPEEVTICSAGGFVSTGSVLAQDEDTITLQLPVGRSGEVKHVILWRQHIVSYCAIVAKRKKGKRG